MLLEVRKQHLLLGGALGDLLAVATFVNIKRLGYPL